MTAIEKVYILGGGAIGMSLAVHLVKNNRRVVAVRTSSDEFLRKAVNVRIVGGDSNLTETAVDMVSLSRLNALHDGLIVVSAKANANKQIAAELKAKGGNSPIVIMQNGLGVETPFIDAGSSNIYRCILYATSQKRDENLFTFRAVAASPIGTIQGDEAQLKEIVAFLSTPAFQFRAENKIQEDIWKKVILNAAFNTICPLLDVDNGIFYRDKEATALARAVILEAIEVTKRIGLELKENELLEQLLTISERAEGQYISTLQDMIAGRETEIEYLNLEIARVAESLSPKVDVPKTKLLGELISIRSRFMREQQITQGR